MSSMLDTSSRLASLNLIGILLRSLFINLPPEREPTRMDHSQRVTGVATDEAALRKVERQLARAGLLIPTRVDVVLRDEFKRAA